MARYKLSSGEYINKSIIDRKVRDVKKKKLQLHLDEHGYYFCTTCKRNDCKPIDCAHVVSVDECQKSGKSELAWDLENLILEGRFCHQKRDNLNLKFNQ